jgi:hypothetical protein
MKIFKRGSMMQEHRAKPKTCDQAQGAVGRAEEEKSTFS